VPSAQPLRECAGRKHISANLDPSRDWVEICSDAQDLKTHLPIISICTARANLSRDTVAVLVLNCCELDIYAAKATHRLKPATTNDLVVCRVRKRDLARLPR
jgi:hypothetical protein